MRIFLIAMLSVLVFQSCSKKEETSELIGQWNLVEVLIDPGDGSGTYQTVTSDKIIEFFNDNTVVSNYSLCALNSSSGSSTSGTYSILENRIEPDNCDGGHSGISFQQEGAQLIITYSCIEACSEKYIQVN